MKISENAARKLLGEMLGEQRASEMSTDEMSAMLSRPEKWSKEATDPSTAECKGLLVAVTDALKLGDDIVVGSAAAAGNGKVKKESGKVTQKSTKGTTTKKVAQGTSRRSSVARHKVFGQSVTSVIRWMGYHKFTPEQAKKALAAQGVNDVSASTLSTCLADGRREDEKWGKRAVLSRKDQQELLAIKKQQ